MAPTWKKFALQTVILFIVSCSLSQQMHATTTYYCKKSSKIQVYQTSETIRLHLKHYLYKYLHPNQECKIGIKYSGTDASKYRWLVSVVNASLKAYSATAQFYNSVSGYTSTSDIVKPSLTSDTPLLDSFQFVTAGSEFAVKFTTKTFPEALSTGLVVEAEPFKRCPTGWFDTGISCYGVPFHPETVATRAEAERACRRLGRGWLSHGIYQKDHIHESLKSCLSLLGSVETIKHPHWVGINHSLISESTFKYEYVNGYEIPYNVESTGDCKRDLLSCRCVIYSEGRFVSESCRAKHRYICMMPLSDKFCIGPSPYRHTIDSYNGYESGNGMAKSASYSRVAVPTLIVLIVLFQ
ncbi:hypothetical protein BOX15_Mlig018025g1 [Macrostomum lignano]|uniref:Uncharacterized protein n=2 Tax=Macrostomum lignano TaxID=282301 RepID=A0A267G700_9PLAT|nr:hypothetical protein BOX15_Mlig018025g1 [Macrostomum lignano]